MDPMAQLAPRRAHSVRLLAKPYPGCRIGSATAWRTCTWIGLISLCVSNLGATPPPQQQVPHQRVVSPAAEPFPGSCPYGHEHLVEEPPDPRRGSLPGTVQRFKVVCQQCGFRSVDPTVEDHWVRDHADALSFDVPLHPLIQDFPVFPWHDENGFVLRPSYRQQVWNGALMLEQLSFSTTEPYDAVVDEVVGHLASFDTEFQIASKMGEAFRLNVLEEGVDASVWIQCENRPGCHLIVSRRVLSVAANDGAGPSGEVEPRRAAKPTRLSGRPLAQGASSESPGDPDQGHDVFEEPIRADQLPPGTDFRAAEKRSAPMPNVTEVAGDQRIQGLVIAELHVDRDGSVRSVEIVQGFGPETDAAVTKALLRWRFAPAILHGRSVASIHRAAVNFQLQ